MVPVSLSADDRRRLRASPAYRRAVWGARLVLVAFPGLLMVAVLAGLGVPRQIGLPLAGAVVGAAFVGALLGWSAVLPVARIVRSLGERQGLDEYQRFALVVRVFLGDLAKLGGRS